VNRVTTLEQMLALWLLVGCWSVAGRLLAAPDMLPLAFACHLTCWESVPFWHSLARAGARGGLLGADESPGRLQKATFACKRQLWEASVPKEGTITTPKSRQQARPKPRICLLKQTTGPP